MASFYNSLIHDRRFEKYFSFLDATFNSDEEIRTVPLTVLEETLTKHFGPTDLIREIMITKIRQFQQQQLGNAVTMK